MGKTMIRIVAVIVLLALLIVFVPSATPLAIGEGAYPVYTPVTLEAQEVTPIPYLEDAPYKPHKSGYLPDGAGYVDPSLSVRVETMRAYDTTIQLTWVQIAHASQLRAELCKPYPSKSTARGDTIAKRVDAVLAINDDWFMHRKEGFIVRNGKELRDNYSDLYDALIIDEKGDLHIIVDPTKEKIEAFEGEIIHALAFGPGLVIDGVKPDDISKYKWFDATGENPRAAIGQVDMLTYVLVAVNGRDKTTVGVTLDQLADIMLELGCTQAYNLDGGNSATLVFNGQVYNDKPQAERSVTDIIYFASATGE